MQTVLEKVITLSENRNPDSRLKISFVTPSGYEILKINTQVFRNKYKY